MLQIVLVKYIILIERTNGNDSFVDWCQIMLKIGQFQALKVINMESFGVYLGENAQEKVLLPQKQVPTDTKIGDELEVFIYKDSQDRLIATTSKPKLTLGTLAVLEVKEVTKIGAFMDWGLEKDLLLPFKEQRCKVNCHEKYLCALYVDKSQRLCATMSVYDKLTVNHNYKKGDFVEGIVYEIKEFGAMVAVDNAYYALIPKRELRRKLKIGEQIQARVTEVRDDGKMALSLNKEIPYQISEDADMVLKGILEYDGILPFNDKAKPEVIEREFHMSKNAFKRAVGHLLKENKIIITDESIRLKDEY